MNQFDVCIIGGGPAGYAAAMRALDFNKKVCLVEKDRIGGAGIYNGALASKAMWEFSMHHISSIRNMDVASTKQFEPSYQAMLSHVEAALFERKFQLACHVKLLSAGIDQKQFTYERGEASFKDANTVEVLKKSGTLTITADNYIIATGSKPRYLPEIEIDENSIVTSDGVFSWTDFPESIVIVGAGVIGCEFATIFSNLRKTRVFLIDKADRILPFEDHDVSELVTKNFEKNGVTIHRNSQLKSMKVIDGKVHYELTYNDGRIENHIVEKALLSVGRVPNTAALGLENAGVSRLPSGHIQETDTRTNVSHIYAVGDLSNHLALVNVGELQGRHSVERMFGFNNMHIKYDNISTIMFLNPEAAAVGINESQAIDRNIPVRVVKIDYSCIARAIAMRKTDGFFKIIVSDDAEMRILGMRAVGEHASSAIQTVALLISMGKGIDELADLIHPHPSIIEGIQECVRMLRGKSIFKPSVFKDKLQYHRIYQGKKISLDI